MDVKKTTLRLAHGIGVHGPIIDAYDSLTYPDIDDSIKEFQASENTEGKVFLPLIQGEHRVHSLRDFILAHAFRTRGYEPHILVCDSQLDLCHAKTTMDDDAMCGLCERRGENISDAFGIETTAISDVLPDEYAPPDIENNEISEYKGVPVSEYATASARCHLKRYRLDMQDSEHKKIYDRFLRSAIICVDAAESMFRKHDFDATLTQHAAYIYGGLFMQVSEKNGVPAYDGSAGYREKSLIFGMADNRLPMPFFSSNDLIQDRLDTELTEREREWLDEFFRKRAKGDDNRTYHAKYGKRGLETEGDKATVGLFTNLNWDGMLDSQDIVFNDPFDWLGTTIDKFKQQDEKSLIIKTHPAEAIHGTEESVHKWVKKEYDIDSISNIKLLPPKTEVDPYELIDQIDSAIVYRSTAGLESAYAGVPVVVAADAHYRELGFTYDPDSPTEYIDLISEIRELEMSQDMIELCQRYCHLLFKENHIHFQYRTTNEEEGNFGSITHDAIKSDENLDLVVSRVTSGKPVSYRSIK